MALYCIGDLHGRYDLFSSALDEIKFDYEKDKLFILGDIIDCNYGAIQIFRHIFKHSDSFELILGNHEWHFLNLIKEIDAFMLNNEIRIRVKAVVDNYMKVYGDISDYVLEGLKDNDVHSIKESDVVIKWLKPSKKRGVLLESVIHLIEYIDYDVELFSKINSILVDTYSRYKTLPFLKEIIECDSSEYIKIKEFLLSKKMGIRFTYKGREILLTHNKSCYPYKLMRLQDKNESDKYIVFGHTPVSKIHNSINSFQVNLQFNFREILSYIDRNNNHYYNLDMGSNVAAILRLDDFEEFYVMKYKRKMKSDVVPPTESVRKRKVGYRMANARFLKYDKEISNTIEYTVKKGHSFITYKDYCMEYLIGVNAKMKEIYYTRVDYIELKHVEVIKSEHTLDNIDDVISTVRIDDSSKRDTEDVLSLEKKLRGIMHSEINIKMGSIEYYRKFKWQ